MAKTKKVQKQQPVLIVESPTKARTLSKILGKGYRILSSFGHVRDLHPQKFSVDIEKGFEPQYIILPEKKKVVAELKKAARNAPAVYLATDEDREGEAISWHLKEALGLTEDSARRIAFHEITPRAIKEALRQPRSINMDLVYAQQARRILDRIIGYQLSPVLWRKMHLKNLSAGRVQSVALRLVVEREEQIATFRPERYFDLRAVFTPAGEDHPFEARLPQRLDEQTARAQLARYPEAPFAVIDKETRRVRRNPPPPFITSTLQQEAHHKLGIPVAQVMRIAQQLYEEGYITYMRTDSTHLAPEAIRQIKSYILHRWGEKYARPRQYTTKNKLAQEAHEAIRPTDIRRTEVPGDPIVRRLYDLIWKRTLASQMASAEFDRTTLKIAAPERPEILPLQATGRVMVFDGFLKIYQPPAREDDSDEKEDLPAVEKGQALQWRKAVAKEKITRPPYRYSEASLVRKLEELGIGRPSTYAPTIATLLRRRYVRKENVPAARQKVRLLMATPQGAIEEQTAEEPYGGEKNKLIPGDVGKAVVRFLMRYFPEIMDYGFTAEIEDELDAIAAGKKKWRDLLRAFYTEFEPKWKAVQKIDAVKIEREIGKHPETGAPIFLKYGRYGPYIQIGEGGEGQPKPRFVSLPKNASLDDITFEEVLQRIAFPRQLGMLEGHPVEVHLGPYGPYLKWNGKNYRVPKTYDPAALQLPAAEAIIKNAGQQSARNKILHQWEHEKGTVEVRQGPYGPYIRAFGKNYKLPEGEDPEKLSLERVLELIRQIQPSRGRRRRKKP